MSVSLYRPDTGKLTPKPVSSPICTYLNRWFISGKDTLYQIVKMGKPFHRPNCDQYNITRELNSETRMRDLFLHKEPGTCNSLFSIQTTYFNR